MWQVAGRCRSSAPSAEDRVQILPRCGVDPGGNRRWILRDSSCEDPSFRKVGRLGGTVHAVGVGIIMPAKRKHRVRPRAHLPTARTRRLLFLAMLLTVIAFLQTVPWLVSNDFGLNGPGYRGGRPAFRFMMGSESASLDNGATQGGQAGNRYGLAAPPIKAGDAWNDDALVIYDGLQDGGRVADKSARGIRGIASVTGYGSRSAGSNEGNFFVPIAGLGSSAVPYEGTGGSYGSGSTRVIASSGNTLNSLPVVSP